GGEGVLSGRRGSARENANRAIPLKFPSPNKTEVPLALHASFFSPRLIRVAKRLGFTVLRLLPVASLRLFLGSGVNLLARAAQLAILAEAGGQPASAGAGLAVCRPW